MDPIVEATKPMPIVEVTKPMPKRPSFKKQMLTECTICSSDLKPGTPITTSIDEGLILHRTRTQVHILCSLCSERHFLEELQKIIRSSKLTFEVSCPGNFLGQQRNQCKRKIHLDKLPVEKLSEKVQMMMSKITSLKMPGAHICITPTCNNVIIEGLTTKVINCDSCNISWCPKCKASPYHFNLTCAEHKTLNDNSAENADIRKMISAGTIRQCPRCSHGVEKRDGCNHITCATCHLEWCWLCTKDITMEPTSHYRSGNCSGKQYTDLPVVMEERRRDALVAEEIVHQRRAENTNNATRPPNVTGLWMHRREIEPAVQLFPHQQLMGRIMRNGPVMSIRPPNLNEFIPDDE